MIVFELICARKHRFEGWFGSGEDFAKQQRSALLSCPMCGTGSVEKLPTAKIRTGEQQAPAAPRKQLPAKPAPATLNEFIDYVLLNTEDVGRKFPEEARRMHREEAPRRDIRGVATREEAAELIEEGVPVLPLPIPPADERH
jgi:hypothetical protein